MCRLYDVTDGEILINGTDIKEYTRESITGLYSVVFQDFKIFSVSLKDNICASSDFDSDRFYACLENANIKDRAERLADKETHIFIRIWTKQALKYRVVRRKACSCEGTV